MSTASAHGGGDGRAAASTKAYVRSLDATFSSLYTTLTAWDDPRLEPDILHDVLNRNHDKLLQGLGFFTTQAKGGKLSQGVPQLQADYVARIASHLDLAEDLAYSLMFTFIKVNLRLLAARPDAKKFNYDDADLMDIIEFYGQERRALIHAVRSLFHAANRAEAMQHDSASVLRSACDRLVADNVHSKLVQQAEHLAVAEPPAALQKHSDDGQRKQLQSHWASQCVQEQACLMQALFIVGSTPKYAPVVLKASVLRELIDSFQGQHFGGRQLSRNMLPKDAEAHVTQIGDMQVMILIAGMQLHRVQSCLDPEDARALLYDMSAAPYKEVKKALTAWGTDPRRHGPVLLAWAVLHGRLGQIHAQVPASDFRPFVVVDEHASKALLHLRAVTSLQGIVARLKSVEDPGPVKVVAKNLLTSMFLAFTISQAGFKPVIGPLVTLYSQLFNNEETLCTSFWLDDMPSPDMDSKHWEERYAKASLLYTTQSMYPHAVTPFLRVMSAVGGSASAASCVWAHIDGVDTLTWRLEASVSRCLTCGSAIQVDRCIRFDNAAPATPGGQPGAKVVTALHDLRLDAEGAVRIDRGATGLHMGMHPMLPLALGHGDAVAALTSSQHGGAPGADTAMAVGQPVLMPLIQWHGVAHRSGWDYLWSLVRSHCHRLQQHSGSRKAATGPAPGAFHGAGSASAQGLADDDDALLGGEASPVAVLLQLVHQLLEHDVDGSIAERVPVDVVRSLFVLLRHGNSLSIVGLALRCVHALVPLHPQLVWCHLRTFDDVHGESPYPSRRLSDSLMDGGDGSRERQALMDDSFYASLHQRRSEATPAYAQQQAVDDEVQQPLVRGFIDKKWIMDAELKQGRYPVTLTFLDLLHTMLRHGTRWRLRSKDAPRVRQQQLRLQHAPHNLARDFHRCLRYVRADLLCRYYSWHYAEVSQRWLMGIKILRIFYEVLVEQPSAHRASGSRRKRGSAQSTTSASVTSGASPMDHSEDGGRRRAKHSDAADADEGDTNDVGIAVLKESLVVALLFDSSFHHVLLSIVGIGNPVMELKRAQGRRAEANTLEQLVVMGLRVLEAALLCRYHSRHSSGTVTSLESAMAKRTMGTSSTHLLLIIASYIHYGHHDQIPLLATRVLTLFCRIVSDPSLHGGSGDGTRGRSAGGGGGSGGGGGHVHKPSLLGFFGAKAADLRNAFLSRLFEPTERISLRVVIMRFIGAVVEHQPGLAEKFVNCYQGKKKPAHSLLHIVFGLIREQSDSGIRLACEAYTLLHVLWRKAPEHRYILSILRGAQQEHERQQKAEAIKVPEPSDKGKADASPDNKAAEATGDDASGAGATASASSATTASDHELRSVDVDHPVGSEMWNVLLDPLSTPFVPAEEDSHELLQQQQQQQQQPGDRSQGQAATMVARGAPTTLRASSVRVYCYRALVRALVLQILTQEVYYTAEGQPLDASVQAFLTRCRSDEALQRRWLQDFTRFNVPVAKSVWERFCHGHGIDPRCLVRPRVRAYGIQYLYDVRLLARKLLQQDDASVDVSTWQELAESANLEASRADAQLAVLKAYRTLFQVTLSKAPGTLLDQEEAVLPLSLIVLLRNAMHHIHVEEGRLSRAHGGSLLGSLTHMVLHNQVALMGVLLSRWLPQLTSAHHFRYLVDVGIICCETVRRLHEPGYEWATAGGGGNAAPATGLQRKQHKQQGAEKQEDTHAAREGRRLRVNILGCVLSSLGNLVRFCPDSLWPHMSVMVVQPLIPHLCQLLDEPSGQLADVATSVLAAVAFQRAEEVRGLASTGMETDGDAMTPQQKILELWREHSLYDIVLRRFQHLMTDPPSGTGNAASLASHGKGAGSGSFAQRSSPLPPMEPNAWSGSPSSYGWGRAGTGGSGGGGDPMVDDGPSDGFASGGASNTTFADELRHMDAESSIEWERHRRGQSPILVLDLLFGLASEPNAAADLVEKGVMRMLSNRSLYAFRVLRLQRDHRPPSHSRSRYPYSTTSERLGWHEVWCMCVSLVTRLLQSHTQPSFVRDVVTFVEVHEAAIAHALDGSGLVTVTIAGLEESKRCGQLVWKLMHHLKEWKYASASTLQRCISCLVSLASQFLFLLHQPKCLLDAAKPMLRQEKRQHQPASRRDASDKGDSTAAAVASVKAAFPGTEDFYVDVEVGMLEAIRLAISSLRLLSPPLIHRPGVFVNPELLRPILEPLTDRPKPGSAWPATLGLIDMCLRVCCDKLQSFSVTREGVSGGSGPSGRVSGARVAARRVHHTLALFSPDKLLTPRSPAAGSSLGGRGLGSAGGGGGMPGPSMLPASAMPKGRHDPHNLPVYVPFMVAHIMGEALNLYVSHVWWYSTSSTVVGESAARVRQDVLPKFEATLEHARKSVQRLQPANGALEELIREVVTFLTWSQRLQYHR